MTARRVGAALTIVAALLALLAPALIMIGRGGHAAFDPVSGALPSGLCMAISLGLLIWLAPRRTSSRLYRGGKLGASSFVFFTVLWLIGVFIVSSELDDVLWSAAATVGFALQIASVLGCGILAGFAFRRDRDRLRGSRDGKS